MPLYEHISTGRQYTLSETTATKLSGFKLIPEEPAVAVKPKPKRTATKPTSSKEGNK